MRQRTYGAARSVRDQEVSASGSGQPGGAVELRLVGGFPLRQNRSQLQHPLRGSQGYSSLAQRFHKNPARCRFCCKGQRMRDPGPCALLAAALVTLAGCGAGSSGTEGQAATSPAVAVPSTSSPAPTQTPTSTRTKNPRTPTPIQTRTPTTTRPATPPPVTPTAARGACAPADESGLAQRLQATLVRPYDDPLFEVSGLVALVTTYEGTSWTYYAGKVGPAINGRQMVGVWADEGDKLVGVALEIEEGDDDGHFDLTVDHDKAFTPAAETGPLMWNDDRAVIADCALQQASGQPAIETTMTLGQYEQLQTGVTTLSELYELVGEAACSEDYESTVGNIQTIGLTCDGTGQPGANVVLLFQDGVLASKSQAGLSR